MRRRLLNLLTAQSMLLCVAVCVLWVRSYQVSDRLVQTRLTGSTGTPGSTMRLIISGRGRVRVMYEWYQVAHPFFSGEKTEWQRDWADDVAQDWFGPPIGLGTSGHAWSPAGFGWSVLREVDSDGTTSRVYNAMFPLWLPAVLLALTPAARLYRRARRLRQQEGRCRRCGYDLRGTRDCCPECGAENRAIISN